MQKHIPSKEGELDIYYFSISPVTFQEGVRSCGHRIWYVSRVNMHILWWMCDDTHWPCRFDAVGSGCLRQSVFPCSPKNCLTPLEWKCNVFSSSLFDFAFRMHNPCPNMPHTTALRVMWFEWGSETPVFLWVGLWNCSKLDWSIIPPPGPRRAAICCSLHSFASSFHGCDIHNSDNGGMSLGSEPPAGFY